MAVAFFYAKKHGYKSSVRLTFKEAMIVVWQAVPSLFLIIIVIGGIIAGVFTATEGSAIAVAYSLILSLFIYKMCIRDRYGIVRQLGLDGYRIAILDVNNPQDYKDSLEELNRLGIDFLYVQGSTTSQEDREVFLQKTVEKYGDIDVLVNNAGVAPKVRQDLLEMTEESFDYVVGTNTKGTMFMTQLVAKQMLKQEVKGRRRGVIVNISSSSVTVPSTNRGEYCVSKAGVAMLTTLYADRDVYKRQEVLHPCI